MTTYAIDLHNHMPLPGGDYKGPMDTTGSDVVRAALAADIDVLGVTDHYALDFFHQVHEAAKGTPLLVLPGAELRLRWAGEEAHLIATFPPGGADAAFETLLEFLGFGDEHRGMPPQHIVIEHDPVAAARVADGLGAIVHVAHADRCFGPNRLLGGALLPRLIDEAPVSAVEFLEPGNSAELGDLASRVTCIQSSDSHRAGDIGRRRSTIDLEELSFGALRYALALPRIRRAASAG